MLKAIVSYSKKVPAETEYSSQGYSLSLETEIPDTDPTAIQTRLHDTFELVKSSVEQELANGNGQGRASPPKAAGANGRGNNGAKASNKQVKYLTDLWTQGGFGSVSDLNARIRQQFGASGLYDLDRRQCSQLLDQLKEETQRAA